MNQMLDKARFQGPPGELVAQLAAFVEAQNDKDRAEIRGFIHLAASSQVTAELNVHDDGRFTLTLQGLDPD